MDFGNAEMVRALIAGGADQPAGETQASAELYDPDSGEWTTTGEMLDDRMAHTATLLDDGMVLVAGGSRSHLGQGVSSLAAAELFDPKTGSWHATGPMHGARAWHTATLLANGTILVAGGAGYIAEPRPTARALPRLRSMTRSLRRGPRSRRWLMDACRTRRPA